MSNTNDEIIELENQLNDLDETNFGFGFFFESDDKVMIYEEKLVSHKGGLSKKFNSELLNSIKVTDHISVSNVPKFYSKQEAMSRALTLLNRYRHTKLKGFSSIILIKK